MDHFPLPYYNGYTGKKPLYKRDCYIFLQWVLTFTLSYKLLQELGSVTLELHIDTHITATMAWQTAFFK